MSAPAGRALRVAAVAVQPACRRQLRVPSARLPLPRVAVRGWVAWAGHPGSLASFFFPPLLTVLGSQMGRSLPENIFVNFPNLRDSEAGSALI